MKSKFGNIEEAYKRGYEDGKKDNGRHGGWVEIKYNMNGEVNFAYKCPACGNVEGFDDCNYCSNCGMKMDEGTKIIPVSKCKECTVSPTGLKEDCIWINNGHKCKCDIPREDNQTVYHGHWNKDSEDDYWECSVCGYKLLTVFLDECDLKHCVKCGSIMDETKSC